jgi:hypothetical protein
MEMRDGMKGNPEESLRQALAEFAGETSLGTASDRVRRILLREVRARAYRRWAIAGLAVAATLSAVFFGITARSWSARSPAPQSVALEGGKPLSSSVQVQVQVPAAPVEPGTELQAGVRPATVKPASGAAVVPLPLNSKRSPRSRKPTPGGEWRRGDVVLTPWYFNTALPPSARSVMVRSAVDARTAMRFGVVPAGDTAPVEILFGEDGLPRAMRFVRRLPTQQN